jgi:hypothetical protein
VTGGTAASQRPKSPQTPSHHAAERPQSRDCPGEHVGLLFAQPREAMQASELPQPDAAAAAIRRSPNRIARRRRSLRPRERMGTMRHLPCNEDLPATAKRTATIWPCPRWVQINDASSDKVLANRCPDKGNEGGTTMTDHVAAKSPLVEIAEELLDQIAGGILPIGPGYGNFSQGATNPHVVAARPGEVAVLHSNTDQNPYPGMGLLTAQFSPGGGPFG